MKKIIMTFEPGKPTKIEASGFTGASCLDATQPFKDALGGQTFNLVEKPEMRGRVAQGVQNVRQGR